MPEEPTPTALWWCASCQRYVQPDEHLEWHSGRTNPDFNEWRFIANQRRVA